MQRNAATEVREYAPSNRELPLLAGTFASLLCVIFGSNAVAIKISLSGLGPLTNAGLRFSIAALGISLWVKMTGRSFRIRRDQVSQLLIVSVLFTLQLSLLYLGLNKTNASRGTLLINLQPFFILFLAHFFIPGDRITKRKVLGLLMGFTGMALVFLGHHEVTADVQIGDFVILLTSFVWACNTTYTKTIINRFEPFHLVLYPMIFSVPLFFLFGYLWDGKMVTDASFKVVASLLYQGLLTASFGFVAWTGLLQKYGAVSLHSFIFIMPVTGVLLGGLVLGEPITLSIVLALLLIASGVLVVNLKARKYAPLFPPRGI
ncbi:MAG: DMT family transporter [Deltaproteobacteria bacterium]|nr:DMT family transporter [Deltaproteobacteria bacterium]MBW1919030.1 DMT family transporter [Deltaproteobacteria bacterium]MBW1936166.1 DMT family transporter [Deltaproteobacteria bacterium]MBW1979159.1 DMT family transporter [Deltaproteobacteria bacterium]MBW2046134.1 DMT family transporter [Deltaproteobacteria bacterium]